MWVLVFILIFFMLLVWALGWWGLLIITTLFMTIFVAALWFRWRLSTRVQFINRYQFPLALKNKLLLKYPQISSEQIVQIEQALKQYFLLSQKTSEVLAMPSQAVDELWHEFILYTKTYQQFCQKAFGRFLHHHPASQLNQQSQRQAIRRTWRLACQQQQLNPSRPSQLPLLFAIDALLAIPNGFHYDLCCQDARRADGSANAPFCAADMGTTGGCASSDSSSGCSNDSAGCSGDSGGDAGGDSGGGCGGGCGGGD